MGVTVLTGGLRRADAPGNIALPLGAAGLPKASVVNVSQTTVIDRRRLGESIGTLDPPLMQQVSAGLRLVLSL